jgi:iron-sulfur cluster assembly accessory protein
MENTIYISDSAAKRISNLLKDEPTGNVFRITVDAGGCNGFQYKFDFTPANADDLNFEKDGAKVTTDPTSIEFLKGTTVDFIEELGGAYFSMKNPNAASSCGCGTSFAV